MSTNKRRFPCLASIWDRSSPYVLGFLAAGSMGMGIVPPWPWLGAVLVCGAAYVAFVFDPEATP